MTAEARPRKRADEIEVGDLIASRNATWTRVANIERYRSSNKRC